MSKPVPAPAPVAGKKKKSGIKGVIYGVVMAMIAVYILPTTLILLVGMVPSAVGYFVDSGRNRTLGPTILFLNFAGVLPALLELWRSNHTMEGAIQILSQPSVLLIMLIPAAVGWLLYAYTPIVIGGFLRRKAEIRIRNLEREQEKLVTEWGFSVKTNGREAEAISLPNGEEEHVSQKA